VVVWLAGATVGHRALVRYYRQKLRPDRQIAIKRDTSAVSKVISHYKALGWTGTTGQNFLPFICNGSVLLTSYCYVVIRFVD